jgi:hypothetical protein
MITDLVSHFSWIPSPPPSISFPVCSDSILSVRSMYCVLCCLYCVLCCFVYVYVFLLVLSVLIPSDNSVAVSSSSSSSISSISSSSKSLGALLDWVELFLPVLRLLFCARKNGTYRRGLMLMPWWLRHGKCFLRRGCGNQCDRNQNTKRCFMFLHA